VQSALKAFVQAQPPESIAGALTREFSAHSMRIDK
jgi:hypothetical protein